MTRCFLALAFALALSACGSKTVGDSETEDGAQQKAQPATETARKAPAASGRISRYTPLEHCQQLELDDQEGGWSLQRCNGAGSYSLLLSDSDARQNLMVERPPAIGKEKAASLDLAKGTGGGFSNVGERVEWRGPAARTFEPDALVVRHFVVGTPEYPDRETAWLLVYALRDGNPCLVARIPPIPRQSEEARIRADGPLRCLKTI